VLGLSFSLFFFFFLPFMLSLLYAVVMDHKDQVSSESKESYLLKDFMKCRFHKKIKYFAVLFIFVRVIQSLIIETKPSNLLQHIL
jgi:hypothetical protein